MQHLKVFLLVLLPVLFVADHATSQELGPIGPSPYDVVEGWHKPFAAEGVAFGGNSGVFAESPDRIFISQRGETRLPNPVPSGFDGYVGSIGINALREAALRTWQNCLMVVDGDGALMVNTHLQMLFNLMDIDLVDFKLEFGYDAHGNLLLADELSPDNMRLWKKGTKERFDKDLFRKDEGDIVTAYKTILTNLIQFV